jgi:hypothetical protein
MFDCARPVSVTNSVTFAGCSRRGSGSPMQRLRNACVPGAWPSSRAEKPIRPHLDPTTLFLDDATLPVFEHYVQTVQEGNDPHEHASLVFYLVVDPDWDLRDLLWSPS